MRELLLASQNLGKLEEMRALVAGLPLVLLRPDDLGLHEAPDETGTTFLENARLKALHYARLSGRLTVSDDSGLSVEALGGAPGLYTSRFGGPGATPLERNCLLLEKLRNVPPEGRTARFTCALALARGERVLFEALEHVVGSIAEAPRGAGGFGYDPVFFYPPFGGTFAEAPSALKDAVSHRGRAFARLRAFLSRWLANEASARD